MKVLVVVESANGLALTRKEIAGLEYNLLHADEIEGTTQTIVYANGVLSQIIHTDGNDNVIRTDTYTFTDTQIIEERAAADGAKLTITTNLADLSTTTVYTAAE